MMETISTSMVATDTAEQKLAFSATQLLMVLLYVLFVEME